MDQHQLDILCLRLSEKTGLRFFQWNLRNQTLQGEKPIMISFQVAKENVELGYVPDNEESTHEFSVQILTLLAEEISMNILQSADGVGKEKRWTWEMMLAAAVQGEWSNDFFEQNIKIHHLPTLDNGFPMLIRLRKWNEEVPVVLKNILPKYKVFWVNQLDIFVFISTRSIALEYSKPTDLYQWCESLIQTIHSLMGDELGIFASTYVGYPDSSNIWLGYKEVLNLADLQPHFFPGEVGLVSWKLGLYRLIENSSLENVHRFLQEAFNGADLNQELLETLETFFALNMNLSEASRVLYIHRNTLIYRLDKVTNLTGHNPRDFKQAIDLYLGIWLQKTIKK
ncbi:helix-turn-helix domain-containing protein [Desulfitobacterium sp.]|uniref:PucR family transcriptional regulator n=1 Tax=Desulfitobacterium sp. TaxID=49981 RepID=UPI002B20A002|nr:helix-turn-helix domain-containing protein [Desulfitobacterium sp.]MEA4900674.1 helix-turn-helix domain-containing protein [Desulfitobacterium sp.]